MEYIIGEWEIAENSKYNVRKAFRNGKSYICRGPYYRFLNIRVKRFFDFEAYNLPLLPVVAIIRHEDELFITYKEAIPMSSLENFSSEKIIAFIIKMAKFHNETGFNAIINSLDGLFILNEEIYFDQFYNEKESFEEYTYLSVAYDIFNKFNKEICEKIKPIIKQTSYENRDFENLKKTLLSLIKET